MAAELKHSEEQFATLVGEILDKRLAPIHDMVSAVVSPPASPDRKSLDQNVVVISPLLVVGAPSV